MSKTDTQVSAEVDESEDVLYKVRDLEKWYESRQGGLISSIFEESQYLKAVDGVSFNIKKNEILGLAGQSGCGKSTLGELLLMLQRPTGGTIEMNGRRVTEFDKRELKEFRQKAQIIFQDPYEALNPRYTVARTIEEPLEIHNIGSIEEREAKAIEALEDAGLEPAGPYLDKLPSELSGGERQRVCIARALVVDPDFIVADEPVSMLDVSIRTGILKLFKELQENRDLSMIYISHDLSTISYLADRTMIMYLGNIVELGETPRVIHSPSHPYTEALLEAVPSPDPDDIRVGSRLEGEVPDPINLPQGCRFKPVCDYSTEKCGESEPTLLRVDEGRSAACYHPIEGEYTE